MPGIASKRRPNSNRRLAAGKIVLADRYIGSNLAHQTERVPPERREEFLAWLKHLEYGLYGLPVEDLVVYLRVPAIEAHRLVGMKSARAYTSLRRDIQEADVSHLEQTALNLRSPGNRTQLGAHRLYQPGVRHFVFAEEIHRAVLQVVESRILPQGAGPIVKSERDLRELF